MTHSEIQNALATYFKNEWTDTEIEWQNVPTLHTKVPFVRFSITFSNAINRTFGDNRIFIEGLINVQVFVDTNKGYEEAGRLADLAISIMENQRFTDVFTYAGGRVTDGKDPEDSDLYNVTVQIPFEST